MVFKIGSVSLLASCLAYFILEWIDCSHCMIQFFLDWRDLFRRVKINAKVGIGIIMHQHVFLSIQVSYCLVYFVSTDLSLQLSQ